MRVKDGMIDKLMDTVERERTIARENGYEDRTVSYTLTAREGCVLLGAINIAKAMLEGDIGMGVTLSINLASGGNEPRLILAKFANEIVERQAPPYIVKAVDEFMAELRKKETH